MSPKPSACPWDLPRAHSQSCGLRGICEEARPELEVLYMCKLFCSSEALDLCNACVGDPENLYIAQNGQLQVQLPTYTGSSDFFLFDPNFLGHKE